MKRLRVPVYYDFASTLCYVAHRVMGRMAADLEELEVELVWTPLDLAGITGWKRGAPVEGRRRRNALRVASDLGVELAMPTHWIDSRGANAVALALVLAESPREATWRERILSAIYEEGRDMEQEGALEALARDVDLELDGLLSARTLAALDEETRRAREAAVTGVPTFMLDGWPFGGIQQQDSMRSVLSRWARKKRASSGREDRLR